MATNKIILKTSDEYMNDYKPVYKPIYPLFMGGAKKYAETVGQLNLKRVEAIGDLDANFILPKDTEMKQLHAKETQKTFKKYFKAIQYIQSGLQDTEDANSIVNQVLDRHHIQFDKMLLENEGTSDSTMLNNGVFWSADPNHKTESSAEISATGTFGLFHKKVMEIYEKSNASSGKKLILFYGNNVTYLNELSTTNTSFIKTLRETLAGENAEIAKMPPACTPSSAHGFLVVNLEQIQTHYIKIPMLDRAGFNEEKNYYWWNFFMGSIMVECLVKHAIIKQPITWGS